MKDFKFFQKGMSFYEDAIIHLFNAASKNKHMQLYNHPYELNLGREEITILNSVVYEGRDPFTEFQHYYRPNVCRITYVIFNKIYQHHQQYQFVIDVPELERLAFSHLM